MINGLSTSVSGLWAFVRKLENAARNIANSNTDGYKTRRARIVEDGVGLPAVDTTVDNTPGPLYQETDNLSREASNIDLSREMPELLISKRGYEANLKAFKTQEEVLDSILDIEI
jgi:flagellar hook protein FlgE